MAKQVGRPIKVTVRYSPEEKKVIEKAGELLNMSTSDYIRETTVNSGKIVIQRENKKEDW